MKRSAIICSAILICLTAAATAFGQKGCEFNIVGTWKAASPDEADPVLYRFSPDGTVTVLSRSGSGRAEMRERARATYKLDYPKEPKAISFMATEGGGVFAEGTTSMEITGYDDASFTSASPGSRPVRWVRVETDRYFVVLAARSGTFYDHSGPAFSMLIRTDGRQTQGDAVGIYSAKGKPIFGQIPAEAYNEFMKEPRRVTDVMLRLEITAAQYEGSLKILRTWERRVREGALLYPDFFMNNILLVKEITEGLNRCGEKIKLYNLDWGIHDDISEKNPPSRVPFLYFKELRRLNESLHVRDDKFHERGRTMQKVGR